MNCIAAITLYSFKAKLSFHYVLTVQSTRKPISLSFPSSITQRRQQITPTTMLIPFHSIPLFPHFPTYQTNKTHSNECKEKEIKQCWEENKTPSRIIHGLWQKDVDSYTQSTQPHPLLTDQATPSKRNTVIPNTLEWNNRGTVDMIYTGSRE